MLLRWLLGNDGAIGFENADVTLFENADGRLVLGNAKEKKQTFFAAQRTRLFKKPFAASRSLVFEPAALCVFFRLRL